MLLPLWRDEFDMPRNVLINQVVVLLAAMIGGIIPAVLTALASGVILDYFFIEPAGTFEHRPALGVRGVAALRADRIAGQLCGGPRGTAYAHRSTSQGRVGVDVVARRKRVAQPRSSASIGRPHREAFVFSRVVFGARGWDACGGDGSAS
jgi:hypothetical protein